MGEEDTGDKGHFQPITPSATNNPHSAAMDGLTPIQDIIGMLHSPPAATEPFNA